MFAHALGMGLFEDQKLRWLEDNEWVACGYIVEKSSINQDGSKHVYTLKREPLRRFEESDRDQYDSAVIDVIDGDFYSSVPDEIIYRINKIKSDSRNRKICSQNMSIGILGISLTSHCLKEY